MSSTRIWNDPELLSPEQLLPFFSFYEVEPLAAVVKANVPGLTLRANMVDEVADATRSLAYTQWAMTTGSRVAPVRVHRRSGKFQENLSDVEAFNRLIPTYLHGRLARAFLASYWPLCSESVLAKLLAAHRSHPSLMPLRSLASFVKRPPRTSRLLVRHPGTHYYLKTKFLKAMTLFALREYRKSIRLAELMLLDAPLQKGNSLWHLIPFIKVGDIGKVE